MLGTVALDGGDWIKVIAVGMLVFVAAEIEKAIVAALPPVHAFRPCHGGFRMNPDASPARLLLATDLAARSDRALDRAAQLASEWHAELLAVHVLDPGALPDQVLAWIASSSDDALESLARAQLCHDLSTVDVSASLRIIRASQPVDALAEAAEQEHVRLVVTGVSGSGLLDRFLLGSVVERLSRRLQQPLLVVRQRPRGPYQRIVVATDLSDASCDALREVLAMFPGRPLTLYHAQIAPLEALAGGADGPVDYSEIDRFIADCGLPATVELQRVVERGAVERMLADHVRHHRIELVVVGAQGRSALKNLLLGSTAAKLLDWLPCDVMVARPVPA